MAIYSGNMLAYRDVANAIGGVKNREIAVWNYFVYWQHSSF